MNRYSHPINWSDGEAEQGGLYALSKANQKVPKLPPSPRAETRTPTVAVAGDRGTGTTARLLDMVLRGAGRSVGLALRAQSFRNGTAAQVGAEQQADAAQALLSDPGVDTLVSTLSPRLVAQYGLGFETIRVAVIMDKVKDGRTELFHTGLAILQRATTDCFIVRVGNIVALDQLRPLGSRRLILVSDRINDPELRAHLNAGHSAVAATWRDGEACMVLLSGTEVLSLIQADVSSPRDGNGKKRRLRYATMFAIAAAFGLGLSGAEIVAAFRNAPAIVPRSD